MISKKEFVDILEVKLVEAGYHVTAETVRKTNQVLTGLGVKRTPDASIGVVVYAENYYNPEMDIDDFDCVLKSILEEVEKGLKNQPNYVDKVIEIISNHDALLNGVKNCLINKELNKDLLEEDYVFTESPLEGLVYLYYLPIEDGEASVTIQKKHLEKSGVTLEELAASAEKNVAKDTVVKDILSVMNSLFGNDEDDNCDSCVSDSMNIHEMYVCTNRSRFKGSSTIVHQAQMIENAFGCGFYILPSSIHEILVVAEDGVVAQDKGADALYHMVLEVNGTEVAREDFLADALYYYKGGTFTKVAG